ncbi:S9 family peptidase [Azospirillum doebereinerae]|uniref:S9 family peptidase n=1 Tax=Azospirillum doebereinerae TaxID=92933 RepID=A0A433JF14_9PROT|nr:S9 family peptidase [Azospirillum doebereinerae]RUQ75739.1 S9 family peptidase [Azospirillum doebereinerae]
MAAEHPLIPRATLFGVPERATVRLSPDGRWLAWHGPHQGACNVWIAPADEPEAARPLTTLTGRGASGWLLHWAGNSRTILYLADRNGDENWVVVAVDRETGAERALSPPGASGLIEMSLETCNPRHPDAAIVAHNARDPRWYDNHLVDVRTGESRELVRNEFGFSNVWYDLDLRPRVAARMLGDGTMELLRRDGAGDGDGGWTPFARVEHEDTEGFALFAGTRDKTLVHVLDSTGRDTRALQSLDLRTGARTLLFAHETADVIDLWPDADGGPPLAVIAEPDRRAWTFFDAELGADHAWLAERIGGEPWIAGHSTDLSRMAVFADRDDGRGHYWLFDRPSRRLRQLFPQREALQAHSLPPMRIERMTARDGLPLVNGLILPSGVAERAAGRPAEPLPMVLHVHGGPWGRQSWGFHPILQWLADRGYAVLSVNFRGSTGFGKAFLNAADGEWGAAMHDDLIDAVDWAVAEGIADPARVAIFGASYGGYAALAGLTFTPEVFACAVDLVGPANLITLLETAPPNWMSWRPVLLRRVGGDPATEDGRAFLWARSPLSRVDAIRRPLLIAQGANDVRVNRDESDRIFAAMRERGLPATYLLFPDEGHWLARPENRLAFHAVAEAFLARHLGGRAEPVGDAFAGSSIVVQPGSAPL